MNEEIDTIEQETEQETEEGGNMLPPIEIEYDYLIN